MNQVPIETGATSSLSSSPEPSMLRSPEEHETPMGAAAMTGAAGVEARGVSPGVAFKPAKTASFPSDSGDQLGGVSATSGLLGESFYDGNIYGGMMSMMDHYRSSLVAPMLSSYTGTPPGNVAVSPSGLHCVDGTGSFLDLIRSSSSSSSCYVPSRSSYYDVVAPVPEPPKYLTTVAPSYSPPLGSDRSRGIKAVVEEQGYISLHLRHDVQVDIAPNQAIRIVNNKRDVTLALSGCATQMAMVHPQGRVLQYNARIEMQTESYSSAEDYFMVKNAKIWPRGVSFTSNNCVLVYLLDEAGARSTTDSFHNLYANNIADSVFMKSCEVSNSNPYMNPIEQSIRDLEKAEYWRTDSDLDCWMINDVSVRQTPDGLVSVERKYGLENLNLQTSPGNGKARFQSSFLYLTASMGDEAHIFVRSNDRRIHYNGKAFVVRIAGYSAGFDDQDKLRIW